MTKRIDTLNALDEALIEETAKQPITVLEDPDAPKVRIFCAMAWVIMRREEPDLTFDGYLKKYRFRDALDYVFSEDGETPEETAEVEADPFPEGAAAPAGEGESGPADAEGPVLSGDGDQPV